MPPLTVVVLAIDEKDLVTQTVRSVEAFAAEILIVDVVSSDSPAADTPWGCKTLRIPWEGDYADLKNRAAAKATGEWILWMEAGEVFQGDFVEPLIVFLACESDRDEQYYMMVEEPKSGHEDSPEEIAQLRLTPRRRGLDFQGRIRETTALCAEKLGVRAGSAPGRILRPDRDIEARRRRARRNRRIAEVALQECGEPEARYLLAQAEAMTILGESRPAHDAYREAILFSEAHSPERLEAHVGYITSFDAFEDSAERQIIATAAALEEFPTDAPLLCALGNLMRKEGRLDLAARSFDAALKHGGVTPLTWHSMDVLDLAAVCLSVCLQKEEKEDEARWVLKKSLEERPCANRVRRRLIELEIAEGNEDAAVTLLDGMVCTAEERENIERIIRGACQLRGGNAAGAVERLQPAYLGGCVDPWCFRWFIRTLVAVDQVDAAAEVTERWIRIDPQSSEARQYQEIVSSLATK